MIPRSVLLFPIARITLTLIHEEDRAYGLGKRWW